MQNTICFISGISKGLGKQLTKYLSTHGCQIIGCGRSPLSNSTKEEFNRLYPVPRYFQIDITHSQNTITMFEDIHREFGRIDVLINNAGGISKFGSFLELSDSDWEEAIQINLLSAVRITRLAYPLLIKSPRPRIINIGSTTAIMPGYYNAHYSTAKAGLLNLSKHLSNIFAKDNILVNSISLGPIKTDLWDQNVENLAMKKNLLKEEADALLTSEETAKIPLKKLGEISEVGDLILHLISEKTKWLTGSNITLDGGKYRGI